MTRRLLDLMARTKIRATFLSGGVHVACLGVMRSECSGAPRARSGVIDQLTSSGIVHPPPPKLFGHLLERMRCARADRPRDRRVDTALSGEAEEVRPGAELPQPRAGRPERPALGELVRGGEEREPATKVVGRV